MLIFVTIRTSFPAAYPAPMDKVDYEAKLAEEVEKLRKYQESLESEYRRINSDSNDGAPPLVAEEVISRAEQTLLHAVEKAAETIVTLAEHADKDSTKFAVCRYILDSAKNHPEAKGDPMDILLKKLTATTADANES